MPRNKPHGRRAVAVRKDHTVYSELDTFEQTYQCIAFCADLVDRATSLMEAQMFVLRAENIARSLCSTERKDKGHSLALSYVKRRMARPVKGGAA